MRAHPRSWIAIVTLVLLVAAVLGTSARPAAAGGTTIVVSVTLSGNGQGHFNTEDGFINCVRSGGSTSGSCKHTYDVSGGPVYFASTYAAESTSCFVAGDTCSPGGLGSAGFLYPGDPDSSISITFRLLNPVAITVKKSGTGSGTVKSTPRGINCGSDCKSDFAKSSSFTLKATPKSGSKFSKWTGGPCDGKGSTCTFTVGTGPYTVTAVFTKNVTATPTPEVTEAPPSPTPEVTPGPTPVVPTPFVIVTDAPSTTAPAPTSAPAVKPVADESGRSTMILALGSLLVIILAAGGLYAMRSRRSTAAASSSGLPPQGPPPAPPPDLPPPGPPPGP